VSASRLLSRCAWTPPSRGAGGVAEIVRTGTGSGRQPGGAGENDLLLFASASRSSVRSRKARSPSVRKTRQATFTGLTKGTAYSFTVRALNAEYTFDTREVLLYGGAVALVLVLVVLMAVLGRLL